jgi:hypothetical protein
MSETFTWIDAAGSTVNLNSGTTRAVSADGISGVNNPGYSLAEAEQAIYAGARVVGVKTKPRDVELPMVLAHPTRAALFADIAVLARALDPNRGDGRLQMTLPDGSVRELYCRCVSGLAGEDKGFSSREFSLIFRAGDPYWYATTPTEITYMLSAQTLKKWFPIFPLSMNSASVFTNVVITLTGEANTWPKWTITGPGDYVRLQNKTTGKSLLIDIVLSSTDNLEIDTRPGHKTCKFNGAYRYDLLSGDLWALEVGANIVLIDMPSATIATSSVKLAYYVRYL